MAALLVIVTIILLILTYLMWMPVILKIDTESNEYYVQLKGLLKADILSDPDEILKVRLKVLFIKFNIFPIRSRNSVKKKRKAPIRKKSSSGKIRYFWKVLRTFKVKEFMLDIDSGDYVINAKMYPLFYMLKRLGINLAINFEDRNRLVLVIYNRPIYIIKSFIHF